MPKTIVEPLTRREREINQAARQERSREPGSQTDPGKLRSARDQDRHDIAAGRAPEQAAKASRFESSP